MVTGGKLTVLRIFCLREDFIAKVKTEIIFGYPNLPKIPKLKKIASVLLDLRTLTHLNFTLPIGIEDLRGGGVLILILLIKIFMRITQVTLKVINFFAIDFCAKELPVPTYFEKELLLLQKIGDRKGIKVLTKVVFTKTGENLMLV